MEQSYRAARNKLHVAKEAVRNEVWKGVGNWGRGGVADLPSKYLP